MPVTTRWSPKGCVFVPEPMGRVRSDYSVVSLPEGTNRVVFVLLRPVQRPEIWLVSLCVVKDGTPQQERVLLVFSSFLCKEGLGDLQYYKRS